MWILVTWVMTLLLYSMSENLRAQGGDLSDLWSLNHKVGYWIGPKMVSLDEGRWYLWMELLLPTFLRIKFAVHTRSVSSLVTVSVLKKFAVADGPRDFD